MPPVVGTGSHSPLWLSLVLLTACNRPPQSHTGDLLQAASQKQELGQFDEALKLAETGEKSSSDRGRRTLFRLRRAEVLLLRGDVSAALALIPTDVAAHSEAGCRAGMIQGWAEFRQGHLPRARQILDQAYGCATSLQNPALAGRIENWRAAIFTGLGDPASADASVRHALEIARRTGDGFLEAAALGNLGLMLSTASRFDEAIIELEQSLRLGERIGARASQAVNLLNLGYCYYRLGDMDKAIQKYQRAREMLASVGRASSLLITIGNIGNVYLSRKDYKTAQIYYTEALLMARKVRDPLWTANWCSNLAMVLIETGDYSAADRYNNEALTIQAGLPASESRRWPELNAAALAAARLDFPRAIAGFTAILNATPVSPAQILEAHAGLGRVYAATGELDQAEAQFQQITSAIEQFREKLSKDDYKLSYLSSLMHFYQDYVELLMSRGKHEKALRVVEASRARILAAHLGNQELARIADAAREPGTSILAFWLAPRRSYVWVLQPGKMAAIPLPGEEIITPLVERHSRMIQDLRDPLQSGSVLFDILLGEVSKLVAKNSRVIVMPDGVLNSLNFETLPTGGPAPHYWIDDVTLSLAPSLAVLASRMKTSAPGRSVLLIGDPAAPADAGLPLPFAAREIEVIQRRVSTAAPLVFTGLAATPEAYRQAGAFRLIHFASHAAANFESPLDSAVLLSGSKLYVRDIMNVPLSADLVTVSACRSAGARTYGGEGLVGFAWAFLQSGAKNVVAGLWDVNDASTAKLMGDLYAELEQGRPVDEALRTAKLHMIRSSGAYKKPYYWAPFQVYTRITLK